MSFERVKAVGWAALETLTSTQMNALDTNLSLATDSRLVPDYIGAINFLAAPGTDLRCGVYNATTDSWVLISGADGSPGCSLTVDGYRYTAGGAVANTGTWGVRDMAVNPSGVIVAVGEVTGSTSKIRQSSDGGATWNTRTAGAADNNALTGVIWYAPSSLFVAVGQGGLITTSPDGVTWTTRAAPGSWGTFDIGSIASNDAGHIVCTRNDTGAGVTDYLRTTDPTNWATAYSTFSGAVRTQGVVWSAAGGKYVAIGSSNQTSPDGITWTATGSFPSSLAFTDLSRPMAVNRHLIMFGATDCYITADYGVTEHKVFAAASATRCVKFGRGQFFLFAQTASRPSLRTALA